MAGGTKERSVRIEFDGKDELIFFFVLFLLLGQLVSFHRCHHLWEEACIYSCLPNINGFKNTKCSSTMEPDSTFLDDFFLPLHPLQNYTMRTTRPSHPPPSDKALDDSFQIAPWDTKLQASYLRQKQCGLAGPCAVSSR